MANRHSTDAGPSRKPHFELADQRFGRLIVLRRDTSRLGRHVFWCCLCDCGNETIVRGTDLRAGSTKSCGCLQRKRAHQAHRCTHGMTGSPEYRAWLDMLNRCKNPRNRDYHHYGERGIQVCERWLKFEAFYADIGKRPSLKHTLERTDNNAGYSPENCIWATRTQQNRNTRSNHRITYAGETRLLTGWAEIIGIAYTTLEARLRRGWSVEQALTEPVRRKALSSQGKVTAKK